MACESLQKDNQEDAQKEAQQQEANVPDEQSYAECLAKRARRHRTNPGTKSYKNCIFILGSAAEVERLCSI